MISFSCPLLLPSRERTPQSWSTPPLPSPRSSPCAAPLISPHYFCSKPALPCKFANSLCLPISISPTFLSSTLPVLSVPPLPSWFHLLHWVSPSAQSSLCPPTVANFCLHLLSHDLFLLLSPQCAARLPMGIPRGAGMCRQGEDTFLSSAEALAPLQQV